MPASNDIDLTSGAFIDSTVPKPGLREKKQRETRQRIAETGLQLFIAHGYESTTLDAIAAAADISRRTFFSYFKSKEEILLVWQNGLWETMRADLLTASPATAPLDAVRDAFIRHISRYTTDEMIAIDRLIRSNPSLMARKQGAYEVQERALFATLCEVWRQPERRMALRLVAMMAIGAKRVALEAWSQQSTLHRPVAEFLQDTFARLKSEL
jgi:AcrR family transcriptional regulator